MEQFSIFDYLYPKYQIDKPIRLIELFSGVGSQAMALRDLGADFVSWRTCEWDVNAIAAYKAIHCDYKDCNYSAEFSADELTDVLFGLGISANGKDPMTKDQIRLKPESWKRTVFNNIRATNDLVDISKVKGADLEIVDTDKFCYILTYSFPCQDLSVAGHHKGMSKGSGTRSGLLWEVERIFKELDELPQVLLMENVPQVLSDENIDDFRDWTGFLESRGYKNYTKILNAKDYGVAQNRERCFMVSILGDYSYSFPEPIPLTKCLNDYLEDEVDEKYYINTPKAQELIDKLIADGRIEKPVSNSVRRGGAKFSRPSRMGHDTNTVGFLDRGDGRLHESNSVHTTDGVARAMTVCEHKDPCKIIQEKK